MKPVSPLSACILFNSWLMSWARSPSLGPGGMLGDRPSRAWFMDRPLWCAADEWTKPWDISSLHRYNSKLDATAACTAQHLAVDIETYVSCLRSFLYGLGSWTHCCCGGTMGDCRASCCPLRKAPGRDCLANVPATPAATKTHTHTHTK